LLLQLACDSDVLQVPILSSAAKGHFFRQVGFTFMVQKYSSCNFCDNDESGFHTDAHFRSFGMRCWKKCEYLSIAGECGMIV